MDSARWPRLYQGVEELLLLLGIATSESLLPMPGFDGRIPDEDIRSIVTYLRTLAPKR